MACLKCAGPLLYLPIVIQTGEESLLPPQTIQILGIVYVELSEFVAPLLTHCKQFAAAKNFQWSEDQISLPLDGVPLSMTTRNRSKDPKYAALCKCVCDVHTL